MTTIENATQSQADEQSAAEQHLLSRILRLLNAASHVQAVFPQIFDHLSAILGCTVGSLALIDDEQGVTFITHAQSHAQTLGARILARDSAAGNDILNGRIHLTPDLARETDFVVEEGLFAVGIRSRINLPLTVENHVLGSLNIGWDRLYGWRDEQLPLLRQVAEIMALAVSKMRLYEDAMGRAGQMVALEAFSRALRLTHSLAETRRIVLNESVAFFQAQDAAIFYPQEGTQTMSIVAAQGVFELLKDMPIYLERSICGLVFRTGQPYRTGFLLQDPLAQADAVALLGNDERAMICAPLRIEQNIVGVMLIARYSDQPFSVDDERSLMAMAEIAGSALHRAAVLDTLEERVRARTQELAQANERLQELDHMKSRFIHDVSHELRTPISNLGLYLHLLAEGAPEKRAHYVSVLQKQVLRLSQLVEDVLQISRLDRDREMAFDWVNLPEMADRVARQFEEKNVVDAPLRVKIDATPINVWGSANLLAEMLGHLINNAIAYTPQGEIHVHAGYDAGRQQAFIRVADTGMGIPPEDMPHLFQRFYRGRRASQSHIRGSGLGLAIAKEIVDRHQGNIEVDSHVDTGSTFTVWLPTTARQQNKQQPTVNGQPK